MAPRFAMRLAPDGEAPGAALGTARKGRASAGGWGPGSSGPGVIRCNGHRCPVSRQVRAASGYLSGRQRTAFRIMRGGACAAAHAPAPGSRPRLTSRTGLSHWSTAPDLELGELPGWPPSAGRNPQFSGLPALLSLIADTLGQKVAEDSQLSENPAAAMIFCKKLSIFCNFSMQVESHPARRILIDGLQAAQVTNRPAGRHV